MIGEWCGQAFYDFLRQLFGSARQFASRQRIGQGGSQPMAPYRRTRSRCARYPPVRRRHQAYGQGDDRAQRAVKNQVQRTVGGQRDRGQQPVLQVAAGLRRLDNPHRTVGSEEM